MVRSKIWHTCGANMAPAFNGSQRGLLCPGSSACVRNLGSVRAGLDRTSNYPFTCTGTYGSPGNTPQATPQYPISAPQQLCRLLTPSPPRFTKRASIIVALTSTCPICSRSGQRLERRARESPEARRVPLLCTGTPPGACFVLAAAIPARRPVAPSGASQSLARFWGANATTTAIPGSRR